MVQYIVRDVLGVFRYLSYGLIPGILVAAILGMFNRGRRRRGEEPLPVVAISCLVVYVVVVLCITFLSRELGSRVRKVDMELFSTWGRTRRTHAFVIENVLLFVPYGYLLAWNVKPMRNVFRATFAGMLSSLLIEGLQLLTGRGYFQIDDVLTNTLGALIGACIFGIGYGWRMKRKHYANVRSDCTVRGHADRDSKDNFVRR
ncbi:MAG: VanZ family protein [Lachnospiraceae bacterium]|nr:VanZ family protein [Lachnospiraceae bacterium]